MYQTPMIRHVGKPCLHTLRSKADPFTQTKRGNAMRNNEYKHNMQQWKHQWTQTETNSYAKIHTKTNTRTHPHNILENLALPTIHVLIAKM